MRLFGATLFICKAIVWLPIAVYVPALTLNVVSGLDVHTITPIVIVICTFYTTVGGIKGVVWTDVIQSFVMFGSIFVLMIKGTSDVGGITTVIQRNFEGGRVNMPAWTLDPTVRISVLSVYLGGTIFKLQGTSINQTAVQRFMSVPTLANIKTVLIWFTILLTALYLCCVYVGLLAFAVYQDCDPITTGLARARDQLVPILVMHVMGRIPGLPGLFVSGVFSAALSSLSTLLNSLAAVILEDFVKPNVRKPLSERQTGFIMRAVVVVFGISSIGLVYVVEKLGMVLQLSATMQSVLYGPMLGIFTVGMLMPWINEKSCLAGSAVGFLITAWIIVNDQIDQYTGKFRSPKLPVSVERCDYEYDMSRYTNSTTTFQPSHGSSVHHISFLLYAFVGASLTIIACNLATLYFGRPELSDVDEELLAPFVVRYLKKKNYYQKVKLSEKIELNGESKDTAL